MIGNKFAPDFDSVHPQGVQSDSLESLKLIGAVQGGETLVLCTFFACAALAIILDVL